MEHQNIPQIDWYHWLLRIISFVVDSIIIYIIATIIYDLIILPLAFSGALYFGYGDFIVLPFFSGILEVLYFSFLETWWNGQTVGKRLLGLQVQTTKGGRETFEKALIRNISKIYWLLVLLDWIIALVTPGPDRRQKISDRFAGTTVVRVASPVMTEPPPPPPPPP